MDNQITKYYGLKNRGATCYLNSLLQVLYMTGDFKSAVERYSHENPDSGFIDRDLDALFKDLKTKTATPDDIIGKLCIDSVYEPRDAAEYFEKILNLASPVASEIFSGILTHRNTCLSCKTKTETDLPFWHLPLELVNFNHNSSSVVDGINEHFKASFLIGEDQIYCDHCDKKSDFEIECVMKQHPDVLLLLLKRFELDYSSMEFIKNNCNIDAPCSLQIPTTNQTYELYAVVDHQGDLRNGHYTATIKDGEDWYRFNDSTVTSHFQLDAWNAYLLFYKKQNDCKAKSAALCPLPTDNDGYIHDGETDKDSERVTVKVVEGVGHEEEEQGTAGFYTVAPPPKGKSKRRIAANLGDGSHQKQPAHEINVKPAERTKQSNKRVYVKTTEVEIRPLKKKKMKGQKDQRRRALEINDNSTERTKNLTKGVWVKIIVEEIRPLTKKDESPKRGDIFSF